MNNNVHSLKENKWLNIMHKYRYSSCTISYYKLIRSSNKKKFFFDGDITFSCIYIENSTYKRLAYRMSCILLIGLQFAYIQTVFAWWVIIIFSFRNKGLILCSVYFEDKYKYY